MDLTSKRLLLQKVIDRIEADRASMVQAARNTYEAATHEESEAEDQYDTRGLEASYLAGAQAKRVAELDQIISQCRFMKVESFSAKDPIRATALVELEGEDKNIICFLLPSAGGLTIQHEGKTIQIVSPKSPLGEAMVGRSLGEVVVVEAGDSTKEYEIISIS